MLSFRRLEIIQCPPTFFSSNFIDDLKTKEPKVEEEVKKEIETIPEADKPSARDRLKDKGLM